MVAAFEAPAQVRTMAASDLAFVASLHRSCLPHGIFPALGPSFLRAYLFTYATSPFGVALIAEVDGRPVGFLVGSFDDRGHRRHVLRHHGMALAARGVRSMLVRPAVAWRFLRTRLGRYATAFLRRGRPMAPTAGALEHPRRAVLAHVAVASTDRGAGAGACLVRTFLARVSATEADVAELLTRDDDLGATGFYERLGWHAVGHVSDRDGLRWARLRVSLDDPPASQRASS